MEKYNKKPEYWEKAKKILRKNDPILSKIILTTSSNQYLTINKKPFETLANAIIGQQISVMAAASILRKLNNKILLQDMPLDHRYSLSTKDKFSFLPLNKFWKLILLYF